MKKKLLHLLMMLPFFASAQNWTGNPSLNNLVAGVVGTSSKSTVVTAQDAQNNVFVAWVDTRNAATGNDIYMQKLNKDGSVAWTANGIPVCTATGSQGSLSMVADGNNGVLVIWSDGRTATNQTYMQRVNADGSMAYALDGIQITATTTFAQSFPTIKLVSATDAIVFYRGNTDLFAQKIAIATGAAVWAGDVTIVNAASTQTQQTLIADGAGGAYLAWSDPRIGTTDSDIFIQHITGAGATSWTANGINITPGAASNQLKPSLTLNPTGGFFITWQDLRTSTTDGNIYAQKVNADGTVAWTAGGVAVCSAAFTQDNPTIVNDGNNGVIIAWSDPRDGLGATVRKLFAQRLNSAGVPQWTANGVSVATGHILASASELRLVAGSTAGTAIIAWQDSRNSATTGNDVYAQKLNTDGTRAWADGGLVVSNATGVQANVAIENDGADNVIAVWTDSRSGTSNAEIYASSITPLGVLPVTFSGITAKREQSAVAVSWKVSSEVNTLKYVIERSTDNNAFVTIGQVPATKSSTYNYTDFSPLAGNNYYRIKAVDADGELSFSEIVSVNLNLAVAKATIFPNPFVAEVKLKLNEIAADKTYQITLTDITGRTHYSETVSGNKLQDNYAIKTANLGRGVYYITVKQGDRKSSYAVVKE